MRNLFYAIATGLVLLIGVAGCFYHPIWWAYVVAGPLFLIGIYNLFQTRHTILRNFPIIGYFRYIFEFISPEIQQYFIERNTDGRPISRNHRSLAYTRAKNINDTRAFGTQLDINQLGYEGMRHSIYAKNIHEGELRVTIGNDQCKHPYNASVYNISAMSYGSLSSNAIEALNRGAAKGNFYHNTGEGGISDFHLKYGGDLVWQVGTGYFGCRTKDGRFDPEEFARKAAFPQVKMIELKLSQGAKPGHGGLLPAVKNTTYIARIRGVEPHTEVLSPPGHSEFSDAEGLAKFIGKLRELADGKPIGLKLCIGRTEEFEELCEKMKELEIYPDFITIDGAEGGTGAAPLEFLDSVGMPIDPALIFARQTLDKLEIKKHIKLIASGKVITAAMLLKMIGLGADLCNSARGFMFALGCIQALRCNTNQCPTGVATQDPGLVRGLAVKDKSERVYHYHKNTVNATVELLAACGKESLDDISMDMFVRGDEFIDLENRYFPDSFQSAADKSQGWPEPKSE